MINLTTANLLKVILPNTNKALDKVLQELSPKELETVTKGKDLKSIINTLLKQSSKDTSQDKVLLNLVKNSPTLKNLGSVQGTLKELITTLKQNKPNTPTTQVNQQTVKAPTNTQNKIPEPTLKDLAPLEKTLSKFLDSIKDIKDTPIKEKVQNSGVFLESKIKTLQTPKQELKQVLQELSKALQTTQLPKMQEVNTQVKTILQSDVLKNISTQELFNPKNIDLKNLETLSKKIQPLLEHIKKSIESPLDKAISKQDVIFTKEFKEVLHKTELLNKPEQLLTQTKTKEMFSHDFKAVLLKAHEDVSNSSLPNKTEILKHIDKLTLQIDYHQLVSHLSNASSLYIPYTWEALEDGSISIKSTKNEKFFCDIDLQLKEYGELKLRLGMFEKNQLNINITTQHKKFKELLQEGIPELKRQLFSVGIMPKEIRFLDDTSKESVSYQNQGNDLKMGFEVKA